MCDSIFIPVLAPVVVLLPPLPLPPRQNYLRVRDDAQTQWRIRVNRSQWGLGLIRYIYSLDIFEESINFKIFRYLRCCGVIPVHSFGSHIRPQPSGLGLSLLRPWASKISLSPKSSQTLLIRRTDLITPKVYSDPESADLRILLRYA